MKTKYRFIHFVEILNETAWYCKNNESNEVVGSVKWYVPWKQWIFVKDIAGSCSFSFSISCLKDIIHFMEQLKRP